jgi:hypothetical protein
MTNSSDNPPEKASGAKKPYAKPKLEIYGNMASITRSGMPGSSPDNPVHPNKDHTRP